MSAPTEDLREECGEEKVGEKGKNEEQAVHVQVVSYAAGKRLLSSFNANYPSA